jgi:uncharacterized phage protein (TIGR02218 family)
VGVANSYFKKEISMPNWLTPRLTTLAFCWKLVRRDGAALGFTSHDQDLAIGGLIYRASPGMIPSAIERSAGFDADAVELAGALTSDALTDDDLASGRWDGARLEVYAVNWEAPDIDPVPLVVGSLGAIDMKGRAFSAELKGATHQLDRVVIEETSPECRASLGDQKCRVDMAGRIQIVAVDAVADDQVTLSTAVIGNVYASGRLRWLDGRNAGLSSTIIDHEGAVLRLSDPPYFPVVEGTRVELSQGCDRRFSTCINRFNNAINFRGEPHLPGNDVLTRYANN